MNDQRPRHGVPAPLRPADFRRRRFYARIKVERIYREVKVNAIAAHRGIMKDSSTGRWVVIVILRSFVMPGLGPGIHDLLFSGEEVDVDGRTSPP